MLQIYQQLFPVSYIILLILFILINVTLYNRADVPKLSNIANLYEFTLSYAHYYYHYNYFHTQLFIRNRKFFSSEWTRHVHSNKGLTEKN